MIRNLGPLSHVLVETGPTLAKSFFADGAADRVWVFRSDKRVDSPSAPSAPHVPDHFVKVGELSIANDTLTEYLNPQSEAFFAPVPSADFVLAS